MAAALLLLLPAMAVARGEDAEVLCADTACYTLHRAELGWSAAQERCRNDGGNLAPAGSRAEAERLGQLLAGGTAWIGLRLERGRCVQPQEPLRGFAWVAGGEPGNYSAWLAEPHVTCLSTRCVALRPDGPDGPLGWVDRPCRAALPAFLCKFSFRGMCGPLRLGGPGRVSYVTPFGVRSPALAAAPFGTLAEVACEEAKGQAFTVCKGPLEGGGFAWHPPGPLCPAACAHSNGGCQQLCLDAPGQPSRCACWPGYTLGPDMASCLPEDTCHPNPCQGACRPRPGGFECICEAGYILAPDGRRCVDVDECLEGPCQHECHNTAGSFTCTCPPGYQPAGPGGRHCQDEDECAQPGICPQLCLNVPGSFHCVCQPGYQRQPGGDACLDVDECLRDPCPGPCRNLPGNFECICPPGFLPQEDGHSCLAAPTTGEELVGTAGTISILQTVGTAWTAGTSSPPAAPGGVTPPSPTAMGSDHSSEHGADGPRLLLYYILGSLVAILLLLAFALALLACRKRAARREKPKAKSAADNYCWVPEQPESRGGAGGERR
ncbi:C1QR1 protein, partial [Penelope pileata]|nr:C1QR1 protein [Penelope pileata]